MTMTGQFTHTVHGTYADGRPGKSTGAVEIDTDGLVLRSVGHSAYGAGTPKFDESYRRHEAHQVECGWVLEYVADAGAGYFAVLRGL